MMGKQIRIDINGELDLAIQWLHSWGDMAAYGLDPDGHVIAFAGKTSLTLM